MASDIDGLLADLRTKEAACRDEVSAMVTPWDVRCGKEKAERLARQIVAVGKLVRFQNDYMPSPLTASLRWRGERETVSNRCRPSYPV